VVLRNAGGRYSTVQQAVTSVMSMCRLDNLDTPPKIYHTLANVAAIAEDCAGVTRSATARRALHDFSRQWRRRVDSFKIATAGCNVKTVAMMVPTFFAVPSREREKEYRTMTKMARVAKQMEKIFSTSGKDRTDGASSGSARGRSGGAGSSAGRGGAAPKVECFKCGKRGHRAAECRGGGAATICYECGVAGHRKDQCPALVKRPASAAVQPYGHGP